MPKLQLRDQRFSSLVVRKEVDKNKYGHRMWLCDCDCGNEHIVTTSGLTSGRCTSCGCVNRKNSRKIRNNLVGQKFGQLIVLNQDHNLHRYNVIKYVCLCNCGQKTSVSYINLTRGATKSCGNCKQFCNGVRCSYKQQELWTMTGGILNYKISRPGYRMLLVDIAIPDEKTVIEYDEWYWHRNKLEHDKQRRDFLISCGWKVLRIKARDNLPSQKELRCAFEQLRTQNYVEITLENWGTT
jgi:very-short-patch-repair endonuclease